MAVITFAPHAQPSQTDVLIESQARDIRLSEQVAKAIGSAHVKGYRGEPFGELHGADQASWFRAVAAFALRYCRRSWRTYAHRCAVARAMVVADDLMQHCFLERSATDPFTWVRMPENKRKALLSLLAKEVTSAYIAALNGDAPIEPADYLELERQEALR